MNYIRLYIIVNNVKSYCVTFVITVLLLSSIFVNKKIPSFGGDELNCVLIRDLESDLFQIDDNSVAICLNSSGVNSICFFKSKSDSEFIGIR